MAALLQIRIHDKRQLVYTAELPGCLVFGRQSETAESPYSHKWQVDHWRIVIARVDESYVSRKHVRLDLLPQGKARLANLSTKLAVRLDSGAELKPETVLELDLPVVLMFGGKSVRVQQPFEDDDSLHGLAEATIAPAADMNVAALLSALKPPAGDGMDMEALVPWMRVTMDVLHSAAGSLDFFARAARAVVDLVGLDAGRVLLLDNGDWRQQTIQTRLDETQLERQASRQVLAKVQAEKRTFWQVPTATAGGSLIGINAVVAAPILNRHGDVIGALYGDRTQRLAAAPASGLAGNALAGNGLPASGAVGGASAKPITKLEAMLVELLASGVAAGLARVEQEQAAIRARVQFEQFFTPDLARELTARPELLTGRELDVSVLVCDIRGFSRVTERLGPARTMEWINDVLGVLSGCVLSLGGVLVDYVGDELMAMFGAPVDYPDHAQRACRAALAMLDNLPKLQERWLHVTQVPMGVGIGINSGPARVGNVGSAVKFKYGPLGNTVNLASRVQGASKYLKATVLITEATFAHLDESFRAREGGLRRLCEVRVVNIDKPVALYELAGQRPADWLELKNGYEEALDQFQRKEFLHAAHVLGTLLPQHPQDGPTQALLSRAVQCLLEEPKNFDPVWELPGK